MSTAGKSKIILTCTYGCCKLGNDSKSKKMEKRKVKRTENNEWKREMD